MTVNALIIFMVTQAILTTTLSESRTPLYVMCSFFSTLRSHRVYISDLYSAEQHKPTQTYTNRIFSLRCKHLPHIYNFSHPTNKPYIPFPRFHTLPNPHTFPHPSYLPSPFLLHDTVPPTQLPIHPIIPPLPYLNTPHQIPPRPQALQRHGPQLVEHLRRRLRIPLRHRPHNPQHHADTRATECPSQRCVSEENRYPCCALVVGYRSDGGAERGDVR